MPLADIVGVGQTKAGEHWKRGLLDLAAEAGGAALAEAAGRPTAVVVGNALGGALGDQRNLGAYVAAQLGLGCVEAHCVEADEASGGAAFRLALALIGAGLHETVLVIGAEKTTDALPDALEAARATGLEAAREAGFGIGPTVAQALAMQRYIALHKVERDLFYNVSRIAHEHGALNKMAFFSWPLSEAQYRESPVVAEPLTVCDTAPPCDGAAAVVVRRCCSLSKGVRVLGSAAISVKPGIAQPALELELSAARRSAKAAMEQAGLDLAAISLFELHDSSSITAVLSLESIGLAERGKGLALASGENLSIRGNRPCWTFGGHKARGLAPGASGVYQIVEAVLQLTGRAQQNQVANARSALVQCLGSFGATAVTHVLGQ